MDKELAIKVIRALNEAGVGRKPCSSQLHPIAEKLGAKLQSGATRWAFVFVKHQLVVKFPKYDETDEDYCEIEMRNYNRAKEYHIEKCLLPVEYAGTTESDIPIYIQPMYTTSLDRLDYAVQHKWQEKAKKLHRSPIVSKVRSGCHYAPNQLWIERAIQIYGKRFMKSFQQWSHACEVNDLHSSNVGFLRKQPIIIDYAGYHG